jgi:hypothetical protein
VWLFALAGGIACSACSLLTSLDGLSDGAVGGATSDARGDQSTTGSGDARSDATSGDAAKTLDAGGDSVTDANDDAGPNLHPNGTFESGTCDPFGGYQGTVDVVTTAHTGIGACRACALPQTTDFFTADDNRATGPGVVGATYHVEAWVRADPTRPPPVDVRLYLRYAVDTNGMFVDHGSNYSPVVTLDATWKRLETTYTFTQPGDLNVFVGADTAPNACFLFDDVVLQRVN